MCVVYQINRKGIKSLPVNSKSINAAPIKRNRVEFYFGPIRHHLVRIDNGYLGLVYLANSIYILTLLQSLDSLINRVSIGFIGACNWAFCS